MKILIVNKFFYPKGGPEIYLRQLSDCQRKMGHEVAFFSMKHPNNWETEYEQYFVENQELDNFNQSFLQKLRISSNFFYSKEAARKISKLVDDFKPDVAHLHNIYHQLSPSVLKVLKGKGIPTVMTLHDYKLICPNKTLFAGGKVCEACKGKYFHHALFNRCVKDSVSASGVCFLESSYHRLTKKYIDSVDIFISPSNWLKDKFVQFGFPEKKLVVINNFFDSASTKNAVSGGDYILAAGRISEEKGIKTLVKAMKNLPDVQLKIAGGGPQLEEIEKMVSGLGLDNVELLGFQNKENMENLMAGCRFFVIPSVCYENAPLVILEAFSYGKPVVGSNIGGIAELVENGETGSLFNPGDHLDLSDKINKLYNDPNLVKSMSKNAVEASNKYTIEKHYEKIQNIYSTIIATNH